MEYAESKRRSQDAGPPFEDIGNGQGNHIGYQGVNKMTDDEDDTIYFADTELWEAIHEAIGESTIDKPIEAREVDPGTVTVPELAKAINVGRYRAKALLDRLIETGIVRRDFVNRIDHWTKKKVQRKGYRYVECPKENGLVNST